MKAQYVALSIITILVIGFSSSQIANAQFQGGGVNYPGSWYSGEGLKVGDQFSYDICHVDYKECTEFQMDFWVEKKFTTGSEEKFNLKTVVYDGNKVVAGDMEVGLVAPEPTGGSPELAPYRSAYKSSLVWLSAFATADVGQSGKGPKKFSAPSWGKIANIGGEQVIPTAIETISVPDGVYETILIQFKTGGAQSKVWIVDNFPFPIKASTWTHVSEGIPPQEYRFQLLDYKENVSSNPFSEITSYGQKQAQIGCSTNYDLVSLKENSNQFQYFLDIKYGPKNPKTGCDIEWFIHFKNKFHVTEFHNQVHYDILVVDENQKPIRSIAQDEGRQKLFSASGQVHRFTTIEENPGIAHYVIWIYGTNPEQIIPPSNELDFFQIDIQIGGSSSGVITPPVTTMPPSDTNIPTWIKNNAKWWSDGQIDDNSFVQGIQYMINEGIMKIPTTSQGSGSGSNEIPSWIKNNAGWWSDGQIDDKSFVQGIQWLIEQGIMRIS